MGGHSERVRPVVEDERGRRTRKGFLRLVFRSIKLSTNGVDAVRIYTPLARTKECAFQEVRRKSGGQVKSREIFLIGVLFFAGFLVSEFLIEHMVFESPLQRLMARIIFQAQFYLTVYLLFALRDTGRRIRLIEALYSREKRLRRHAHRYTRRWRFFSGKERYGK